MEKVKTRERTENRGYARGWKDDHRSATIIERNAEQESALQFAKTNLGVITVDNLNSVSQNGINDDPELSMKIFLLAKLLEYGFTPSVEESFAENSDFMLSFKNQSEEKIQEALDNLQLEYDEMMRKKLIKKLI